MSHARAKRGIITSVRKELAADGIEEREEEGIVERIVKTKKGTWRIIAVYVSNDIEKKIKHIKEYTNDGGSGEQIIIEGDFNARTGEEEGLTEIMEERRKSKDKEINLEGRKLLKFVEKEGLRIMNGTKGDKDGEFTFIGGRGESVIDYIIRNQEIWEKTEEIRIGDAIDSDHQPVILKVEGTGERRKGEKRVNRIMNWSKEGTENYKERMKEARIEGANIEEVLEGIKDAVKQVAVWKEIREDQKLKKKKRMVR